MNDSRLRAAMALAGLAALCVVHSAVAAWPGPIKSAVWTLQSADGKVRWLEIHNLNTAHLDGAFHVQIMERRRSDPPSSYTSLADHMALTEAALRASIVSPRPATSVYPERFQSAYGQWQAARMAGTAAICNTNVVTCLSGLN